MQALLDTVVERFSARERAIWEGRAAEAYPTTPPALAAVMAMAARVATGPQLSATGAQVNREFLPWMRLARSTDPAFDPAPQLTVPITTLRAA